VSKAKNCCKFLACSGPTLGVSEEDSKYVYKLCAENVVRDGLPTRGFLVGIVFELTGQNDTPWGESRETGISAGQSSGR
jgi:hypothetical protein